LPQHPQERRPTTHFTPVTGYQGPQNSPRLDGWVASPPFCLFSPLLGFRQLQKSILLCSFGHLSDSVILITSDLWNALVRLGDWGVSRYQLLHRSYDLPPFASWSIGLQLALILYHCSDSRLLQARLATCFHYKLLFLALRCRVPGMSGREEGKRGRKKEEMFGKDVMLAARLLACAGRCFK